MARRVIVFFPTLLIAIFTLLGCNGAANEVNNNEITSETATLTSINVTPAEVTAGLGTKLPFAATGIYSNNTTQDLTKDVVWKSSNPATASIVSEEIGAVASTISQGDTIISASLDGVKGSAHMTVSSAVLIAIDVTPSNPSIAVNTEQEFKAKGTYSDGTTQDITDIVVWSSSSVDKVQFSDSSVTNGLAMASAIGSSKIIASFQEVQGNTTLTVTSATVKSISITPVNPSIPLGIGATLSAIAIFSDDTTQDLSNLVSWSSTNTNIAQISNIRGTKGRVESVSVGNTQIRASFQGVETSTLFTVTPAELLSISVSSTHSSIPLGLGESFIALGEYSDGTTQNLTTICTWSSSDTSVATILNTGAMQPGSAISVGEGTTTITADFDGIQGNSVLTVRPAELDHINFTCQSCVSVPGSFWINSGTGGAHLYANGHYTDGKSIDLTYLIVSSDINVADISRTNGFIPIGFVFINGIGTTTFTASFAGVEGSVNIRITPVLQTLTISPVDLTITSGTFQSFIAMGEFADGSIEDVTNAATWDSSDTTVAYLGISKGTLISQSTGISTISAKLFSLEATTTLTVVAP